jgi:hypothetical protein
VARGRRSSAAARTPSERQSRRRHGRCGDRDVDGAAGGLGGFFRPILARLVRDADGTSGFGFMLLSEIADGCLIINLLVVQRRATPTRTME